MDNGIPWVEGPEQKLLSRMVLTAEARSIKPGFRANKRG